MALVGWLRELGTQVVVSVETVQGYKTMQVAVLVGWVDKLIAPALHVVDTVAVA